MDATIQTPSPTPPTSNVTSPEFAMFHYSSPFPLYGWISMFFPILRNPYIVESLRLFLFGSVLETCRRICRWALDRFTSGFFVTAHFQQGDWAFDWLSEFLAAQEIWTNSREYRVTVSNDQKALAPGGSPSTTKVPTEKGDGAEDDSDDDGYPQPLYFPASDNTQVIRWRGRWIQVTRKAGHISYNTQTEEGSSLAITIYTRKKQVLDDLVAEARQHYISTRKPPLAAQTGKKSNLTIKATFEQSDYTYSWILEFLNTHNAWQNTNELIVTAKSDEQKWGMALGGNDRAGDEEGKDEKLRVYYQPCKQNVNLWNWKGTWIQLQRNGGAMDYRSMKESGGSISLILFTGRKETLDELISAAAEQYWSKSSRRVTVHMYESYRDWSTTITKQIRPMDSLILPHGMTDLMIGDLRDFMDNKDWYAAAGIPWRRGVLLWGPPGTGKSTTVHAIAGELQLEIYCVPLSSGDIDDGSLQRLVAATPPSCILLLEDIDCGFRSRDNEGDDDDDDADKPFNPYRIDTKKRVTLSGLLNVLDSVSSEEGRIVIATTNHIDKLDPALLRPGRMDLLVEYKLATRQQNIDLFTRFYSRDLMTRTAKSSQGAKEPTQTAIEVSDEAASLVKKSDNSSFFFGSVPTAAEIADLSIQFADKVPESRYSIAQLQGYLLCSKRNPRGAIMNLDQWLADREKEEADKEARRAKKAEEKAKWLKKEKFRQRKERQMDEEMEKEMLAEAEETKKSENVQEKGEQDGGETEERRAADDDLKTPDGASDKDSEPVMVESARPSSSS
ncbi:hypothetical protein M407DRAFT_22340 [Tulasnella calospora MUT 4182]|uniref:AAA+ ATPase domain-containing protein n=1 Tax=Tulasnella calospora MUT 4182 TaxID=1051891 RepID=A0A0C3QN64_9AGAM|nr:hypothetical protein M407DRAFT_22340 [Tulasnella calospora MUT 4182]